MNCWLSQASSWEVASLLWLRPGEGTQGSARDGFPPWTGLAMSADVSGCSERLLLFREEENGAFQNRALEIKGQDGPSS